MMTAVWPPHVQGFYRSLPPAAPEDRTDAADAAALSCASAGAGMFSSRAEPMKTSWMACAMRVRGGRGRDRDREDIAGDMVTL